MDPEVMQWNGVSYVPKTAFDGISRELAEVLKDRKVQGWTEYLRMQAKVEALTEFAEFCDFHHHSCKGRLGQHIECNCGYKQKRESLREALALLDGSTAQRGTES